MNDVINRIGYSAFGLHISSEIPLPTVQITIADESIVDVEIEIGDLSSLWSELATNSNVYVIKDDFVMFQLPNSAIYLIKGGKKIIVSPLEGASLEKICLYLNGYCMSILLLQRKVIPLHGSAVVMNGKAYAIVGHSGAGKSTLTKALLDKGYYFLTDDVIPVSLCTESHQSMVMPAFPEQKLWEESLSQFGIESSGYPVIYEKDIKKDENSSEKRTKYVLPVSQFSDRPVPLAGVFEIVKTENTADIGIYPMQRMEQLKTLIDHTFHRAIIPPLGLLDWHFKTVASILSRIEVFKIRRPTTYFAAPEMVSLIIQTIDKENEDGRQYSIGS